MDHKHKCKSLPPKNLQKNAQKILTTLADIDFLSNIKKKKRNTSHEGEKRTYYCSSNNTIKKKKGPAAHSGRQYVPYIYVNKDIIVCRVYNIWQ